MADFTKTPRPFYPQLLSQNREIRLLHLLPRQPAEPGEGSDKLQCRLSVVSLDSNPSYEALSYRWGNGTSSVLVEGHGVTIPKNLDEALRRFRLDDRERILWADAICIDQSQVAERNAQVALMADIYKKCERCLVWMGNTRMFEYSGGYDSGLGSMQELLAALSKKHHLNQPGAPPINTMFGITRVPLMYLNMASWWQRIWVVQEVILAPQSLVAFGSFELKFSDLVDAMDFINEHDIASAWNANGPETDQLCRCMDNIKITFIWANLLELRDLFYHLLQVTRPQPETRNDNTVASVPAADILDVLLSVRHRECTDSRDKIFGILSLVKDWGSWEPIKADYSKDALQVFSEVAAQMIQGECGPKTLLLARGANAPSKALTGLPTWAPDWTTQGSDYEKHLFTVERQAPQSQNSQNMTIHGSTLFLSRGLSRGKIAEISGPGVPLHKTYGQPASQANYDLFVGMLDSWREFAGVSNGVTLGGVYRRHLPGHMEQLEQDTSPKTAAEEPRVESGSYTRLMEDIKRSEYTVDFMPQILNYLKAIVLYQDVYRRMGPDEEAFFRTLIHDTYPLHLRQPQYQKEALCILRLLLIFYNTFADPDRFLTRLNSVVLTKMSETLEMVQISRKSLFKTDGGMLGIGPMEMMKGDEIFCFEGVESPFVLRPVGMRAVDTKGDQHCYELVGHCYVDGLGNEGLDWGTAREVYLQ